MWWSHLFQTEAFLCRRKGEVYGILREFESSGGPSLMFTIAKVTDSWGCGSLLVVQDIPMEKFPQVIILVGVGLGYAVPEYPWC